MKLDKVKLGMSAITNTIYAYIPETKNPENMLHKKDVTEDFRNIGIVQIAEKQKEINVLKAAIENLDINLLHNYFRGVLSNHGSNSYESADTLQYKEDAEIFRNTFKLKDFMETNYPKTTSKK